MSKNKMAYVITTVLALAGFSIIGYGLYCVHYGHASLAWPTCTGTVTDSEVHRSRRSGGRSGGVDTFRPKITYSYTVAGQQYTGNRYAIGDPASSGIREAQKIVGEHPVGSEVTVYYSPSRPGTSVLVPGVQPLARNLCIFGAVFSAIPLVVLLMFWRMSRQLDFSEPGDRSEPVITWP